jgi:predicted DNA-binding transcriptional regulator AlpA
MKRTKPRARAFSRAIRLPIVCDLTGSSPATVWRRLHTDADFPKPFKLSAGITVWDEAEILSWIAAKRGTRDHTVA